MTTELLYPPKFVRFAKRAIVHHSLEEKFKMACVIVQRKKMISLGINYRNKTHPVAKKFDPHKTMHAEIHAITRAVNKEQLIGSTVVVYRQDNNGNQAMARPCMMCQKVLKHYGIKYMLYTNDKGTWTLESVY